VNLSSSMCDACRIENCLEGRISVAISRLLTLCIISLYSLVLSQNQDVLKPFLLACDTKNVKLVTISMGCLRELISHRAMPEVHIGITLRYNAAVDLHVLTLPFTTVGSDRGGSKDTQ